MAALLTPELIAQLLSAATTLVMLVLYHWQLGPTKPHPFLNQLLSKVDARTAARVNATAEAVLDFVEGRGVPQAPPPAKV